MKRYIVMAVCSALFLMVAPVRAAKCVEAPSENSSTMSGFKDNASGPVMAHAAGSVSEPSTFHHKGPGYAGYADVSLLATMTGESAVSVSTTHGYAFNPWLFIGGGVACDIYREALFTPVYAAARFTFIDSGLSPYADVRVGFSPGKKDDSLWAMGAYFTPALGLRFALMGRCALNVEVAYVLQSQSTDYSYEDGYKRYFGTTVTLHHSLSLRVGLAF